MLLRRGWSSRSKLPLLDLYYYEETEPSVIFLVVTIAAEEIALTRRVPDRVSVALNGSSTTAEDRARAYVEANNELTNKIVKTIKPQLIGLNLLEHANEWISFSN